MVIRIALLDADPEEGIEQEEGKKLEEALDSAEDELKLEEIKLEDIELELDEEAVLEEVLLLRLLNSSSLALSLQLNKLNIKIEDKRIKIFLIINSFLCIL